MRLTPIPADQLTAEQKDFYDDMRAVTTTSFKDFITEQDGGALIGPFNVMLHTPAFGWAAWDYTKALLKNTTIPRPAHEVAILVVGAHYRARYELYAHTRVAESIDLPQSVVATIISGQRPTTLTPEQLVAFDTAKALCEAGALPGAVYRQAMETFGADGFAELVYLVGGYCQTCILLNAYDVAVPDGEYD